MPKVPKIERFAVSLQDLKKEGRNELDFLPEDKQIFLQIETINFG